MKLWDKEVQTSDAVLRFTIGNDPMYDRLLAPFDIIGSVVHVIMLGRSGLLTLEEAGKIGNTLLEYHSRVSKPDFHLDPEDEDIHSHLEKYLVQTIGDTGKKVHMARSRNDQVMIAFQLFMKERLRLIIDRVEQLFDSLISQGTKHRDVLIPGYTHTQVAMPSSVAVWFGAYAESLVSDLKIMKGVLEVLDQNALGTAAGYGTSFPINRELTTQLAGFNEMMVSAASPQLTRGKLEASVAFALGSIGSTLSRLSADMIFYMSQEVNILTLPEELTTGSSIMPHKKNPDVLELIRAHCNIVGQVPATLQSISNNLVSGYHRDFQLIKEVLIPSFDRIEQCLQMMELAVSKVQFREDILKDEKYRYIFSVEVLNEKVIKGMPFRDAYKEVSKEIASGTYSPGMGKGHTHLGSIHNPGLDKIKAKMQATLKSLQITPAEELLAHLRSYL